MKQTSQQKMAHTPLPLKVAYVGNCGAFGGSIEDASGNQVALITVLRDESNEERLARAEYIVTACNSFPALVEALTNLMRRLNLHFGGVDSSLDWKEQSEARFALAKAGSGQSVAVAPESDAVSGVVHDGFRGDHKAIHCSELIEYFENRLAALQASHDELLEALRPFTKGTNYVTIEQFNFARFAIKKAEALKEE